MKFLNNLKQRIALSKKSFSYINRYHTIYKCVISEAKKRFDNKRIESSYNPNKTMWHINNNKTSNSGKVYQNIRLHNNGKKIIHPQDVADTFNSYFISKVEELVGKNRSKAG
jgi:hypothetical protein